MNFNDKLFICGVADVSVVVNNALNLTALATKSPDLKLVKLPNVTGTGNINITGTIQSSGNITGTLATASQPNITSVGTLTSFTSTGIDDNATSTAVTIDSSQNVGIKTTSPSTKIDVVGGVTIDSNANTVARFRASETSGSDAGVIIGSLNGNTPFIGTDGGNASSVPLTFRTENTERMRIKSDGDVLINATSSVGTGKFQSAHNSGYCSTMYSIGNNADYIQFWNGSEVGSIKRSGGTGVSYNTSSDYRLKENVSYDFDATTRLKQLKPARFNFIADADTTVDGFLAHEVSSVVPEAISGEKDATETKEKVVVNANGNVIAENIEQTDWEAGKIADENGNTQYPIDSTWEATKVVPVYQGIDQAKLVPLLVKTIQELEARITELENK